MPGGKCSPVKTPSTKFTELSSLVNNLFIQLNKDKHSQQTTELCITLNKRISGYKYF